MSHDATNWAIKQRGIKPALKVVLWNLCDRYHPDNGCFPSQDTLAADCEVPRSTLNVYLQQLEDMGLIAREQRRDRGSNRQERTRYRFPFEPEFPSRMTENPRPETGHGPSGAESRNGQEPSPENGESRVQNLDTNPVREPVKETGKEREGASAGSENSEDDPHRLTKRVKALEIGSSGNPWPGAAGSSTQWAVTQFRGLSPEDRKMAEERRDGYLELCRSQRVKPVALGVYFRDRKFETVQPKAPRAAPVTRYGRIMVPVFGPVWAVARMLPLLDGPVPFDMPDDPQLLAEQSYETLARTSPSRAAAFVQRLGISVGDGGELFFPEDFKSADRRRRTLSQGYPETNRLHDAARERSNVSVPAAMERLKELCEAVPLGSPTWDAWREHHERMGWPFVPVPAGMKVVYFPKGGPEGLEEFERAARSLIAARDEDDAA